MIRSNRDNFLEIVRAWCDYARVCLLVKHEVMTFAEFRAMECEWDKPPQPQSDANDYAGAIGRLRDATKGVGVEPKPDECGVTIKSVTVEKVRPMIGPPPLGCDLPWLVKVSFDDKDVLAEVCSEFPKFAAGNVVIQALHERNLVEVIES